MAQAAEAAAAQERFWPMRDYLFAHQHELADSQLVDHARAVGLDTMQFARELAAHAHCAASRPMSRAASQVGCRARPCPSSTAHATRASTI
jgi:predicted DsbA family dithiol-disulfide isomerase